MAGGVSIRVEGLEKIKQKYKSIPQETKTRMDHELHSLATDYESKAVQAVPVNIGMLKQGITSAKLGEMHYEVVSHAPYSAYVEFGTKTKVKIPFELSAYAAQFRGKGTGNLDDFFKVLTEWVKLKGIAAQWSKWGQFHRITRKRTKVSEVFRINENEKIAKIIMIKILMYGIEAQPFFFPHLPWARTEVQTRSKQVLKQALK